MIGVLVTFTQTDKFDRSTLATIADEARGTFEGMPGLRFRDFTLDDDGPQARNFYLWDDEEDFRAFFTEELVRNIVGTGDLWRRAQDRIPRHSGVRRQLWHLILVFFFFFFFFSGTRSAVFKRCNGCFFE